MSDTHRRRLLDLLRDRSFLQADVVLASGETSDYYIDGKMTELHPEGAFLIGEAIYERVQDLDFDAIGGLAIGAVPLTISFVINCHLKGKSNIEGFLVREEAKTHGTQKRIEGRLPERARVVIVDDVVTSGGSVIKALKAVEQQGATIVKIISLVDRERGARERFEEEGYSYEPLFTKQDFLSNVQS